MERYRIYKIIDERKVEYATAPDLAEAVKIGKYLREKGERYEIEEIDYLDY